MKKSICSPDLTGRERLNVSAPPAEELMSSKLILSHEIQRRCFVATSNSLSACICRDCGNFTSTIRLVLVLAFFHRAAAADISEVVKELLRARVRAADRAAAATPATLDCDMTGTIEPFLPVFTAEPFLPTPSPPDSITVPILVSSSIIVSTPASQFFKVSSLWSSDGFLTSLRSMFGSGTFLCTQYASPTDIELCVSSSPTKAPSECELFWSK
mmetsp:Transcript_108606/g.315878  ORF Transcript_108606/g.315878 Transcript_108606/m.315878 type:complete len:214 (+) Transcript_108606:767-1408(+)